ncbi:MAG: glucose-6-phosphate dehydrogenase [Deltaproteobacteria bacterium]
MDLNQQIFSVAKSPSCRIVTPEPCGLIIFGASGDLARRKLIPAIYRLFRQKLLPAGFFVLGIARTEMSTAQYRQLMLDGLNDGFMGECDHACWRDFSSMLNYRSIDYDDPKSYRQNISEYLPLLEEGSGSEGNRIFYLATPPTVCQDIIANLQAAGLSKEKGNSVKIVIEKPFGRDTESSQKLDASLLRGFEERQIYRIDHYLAKETVQNILMFRFANSIFEPLWNRRYIDHIQITAMETLGIEQRAGYYEQSGVLRDMFQNHMLQLLSLTAMEPPALFTPERVREEKAKVFQSVRPFPLDRLDELLVTGQYGKGTLNDEAVRGYREEPGVAADSRTPTYAALKLFVDNWRWNGVPFYLRSGKRMRRRTTEISIHFKPVPHMMFTEAMGGGIDANILVLKVQPDEGITLEFQAKNPGSRVCLMPVQLNFAYLRNIALEAYERVLLDCMEGDQMLFVREDAVSLTWELLTPLIERVESGEDHPLSLYAAGSDGPAEAVQLLERGGRLWRAL